MGNSDWYRTNTSYYSVSGTTKTFVSKNVSLVGCAVIPSSTFGTTLDNAAGHLLTDVIANQIIANNWVSTPNDIYFVLTSKEIVVTESSTSTFNVNYCGFHGDFISTSGPTTGTTLQYAFVGDSNNSSACSVAGTPSANGNPSADAMASVVAHELVETVSDPLLNGWYDNAGYENGDKCAWIFGKSFTTTSGGFANSSAGGVNYYLQENVAANLNNCVSAFPGSLNSITGITPATGAVGSSIVISGANFGSTNFVFINGQAATVTAQSSTSITATVPTGATSGPVTVVSDYGISTSPTNFTVTLAVPTISKLSASALPVGGTLTITGTNLSTTSSVQFGGGVSAKPASSSASTVSVIVPAGASSGPVTVVTSGGSAISLASLTIALAPTITGFTPSSSILPATITISGTNLLGATNVKIGTVSLTSVVAGATQITATIPSTAKTGTLAVTTPGGTATSTTFTVLVAPTISSFTPTTYTRGATTTIKISGSNLTGATSITLTFGAVIQTLPVLGGGTASSVSFTIPNTSSSWSAGSYSLRVTTPIATSNAASILLTVK